MKNNIPIRLCVETWNAIKDHAAYNAWLGRVFREKPVACLAYAGPKYWKSVIHKVGYYK